MSRNQPFVKNFLPKPRALSKLQKNKKKGRQKKKKITLGLHLFIKNPLEHLSNIATSISNRAFPGGFFGSDIVRDSLFIFLLLLRRLLRLLLLLFLLRLLPLQRRPKYIKFISKSQDLKRKESVNSSPQLVGFIHETTPRLSLYIG